MTSIPKDVVLSSSSERLAERISGTALKLKGFSCFFVTKSTQLKSPTADSGIISIRPGLYGKRRQSKSVPYKPVINNSELLTFKPRRDTTSLGKTGSSEMGNPRRYLMVAFNPLSTVNQRKALSRIFHRTPLIRLRPGIVLLPQIRTRRVRLYSPALLRPSEFISRLLELGADVWYAPRLELLNPAGDELLTELIRSHLQIRGQRIITGCRSLFTQLKIESKGNNQVKRFNLLFVTLRAQMRLFRKQAQFFQNEFGIVFSPLANRVASAVTRVGQRLSLCDN